MRRPRARARQPSPSNGPGRAPLPGKRGCFRTVWAATRRARAHELVVFVSSWKTLEPVAPALCTSTSPCSHSCRPQTCLCAAAGARCRAPLTARAPSPRFAACAGKRASGRCSNARDSGQWRTGLCQAAQLASPRGRHAPTPGLGRPACPLQCAILQADRCCSCRVAARALAGSRHAPLVLRGTHRFFKNPWFSFWSAPGCEGAARRAAAAVIRRVCGRGRPRHRLTRPASLRGHAAGCNRAHTGRHARVWCTRRTQASQIADGRWRRLCWRLAGAGSARLCRGMTTPGRLRARHAARGYGGCGGATPCVGAYALPCERLCQPPALLAGAARWGRKKCQPLPCAATRDTGPRSLSRGAQPASVLHRNA